MQDVEVIQEPAAAVAALDPVRARLLAELREPASAATLATRVGLSRQKVNYHLRQLEAHGLVEPAGTRTWGGLTERLLVATAAGYVVSPEALGTAGSDPDRARDRDRLSAAYVIALAARVVREVGGMARNAARQRKRLPVLGLDADVRFRTPADRAAFADELTAAVTRLVAKYHDQQAPQGRWQRLTVTIHPIPKGVDPAAPREPAGPAGPLAAGPTDSTAPTATEPDPTEPAESTEPTAAGPAGPADSTAPTVRKPDPSESAAPTEPTADTAEADPREPGPTGPEPQEDAR